MWYRGEGEDPGGTQLEFVIADSPNHDIAWE